MKFEINTDVLSRDKDNLETQLQGLRKDLSDLTTSMDSLNQTWEGIAKEAYLLQYQSDKENMENLCKTLEEFIKLLGVAQKQYIDSDNKVKTTISQIRI